MLRKTEVVTATFIFLIAVAGCGKSRKGNIVPESRLPVEKQEEIRAALRDMSYIQDAARKKFAERYGKEAVPLMIERIMEVYKMGSDWKHQREYAVAENLIYSLGELRDNRALPALRLWLTDKKYRVFRSEAAYALGKLGSKKAVEPLWQTWDQEKGYLEKGDDQGPWPFPGYHPTGGYVHAVLSEIGKALFKLGEKKVIGELIEVAKMSQNRWRSGYSRIIEALGDITGKRRLSELSYDIKYWEKWWEQNKAKYE